MIPQRAHARIAGLRTKNSLNSREHWRWVSRRVQAEHRAVLAYMGAGRLPELPVRVTLTRVSPGHLDPVDALGPALKGVRDAVAWLLLGRPRKADGQPAWGVGDDDPRIGWVLAQRKEGKGVWAVEIEVVAVRPGGEG